MDLRQQFKEETGKKDAKKIIDIHLENKLSPMLALYIEWLESKITKASKNNNELGIGIVMF